MRVPACLAVAVALAAQSLLLSCLHAAEPAGVRLWSDSAILYEGDALVLRLKTQSDCHGRLLYHAASGIVYELAPAAPAPGAPFLAIKEYALPDATADARVAVSAPFGRERAVFIAAPSPLPALPGQDLVPGIRQLSVDLDEAIRLLRQSGTAISVTTYDFETRPDSDRGFIRQNSESPIDMTGAAGRTNGKIDPAQ